MGIRGQKFCCGLAADRGQKTEDRGQRVVRRVAAQPKKERGKAATKLLSSVFRPPSSGSQSSDPGFTLIELVIVIAIISVLAGILINKVWFYQEQAEKASMEQVAGALQSALILQYAHLMTQGQEAEVGNLVKENPTQWLMRVPPNYLGEFADLTPTAIAPGNWAFDLKSRELIYVPSRADYFTPGKDGIKWVRYHARLNYEQARGKRKNKAASQLSGLLFEPVEPYQWSIGETNEHPIQ